MGSGRGGSTTTTNNDKSNNHGGAGVGGRVGAGGSGVGLQSIPSGFRKIVQNLKEIVNCPEPEIYAMLIECNMDPNEAVNRLLSQDCFREVKSKREKKKEIKDTSESRPRGTSGTSNRGRSSVDRYSSRGESGALHGRPAPKKENGSNAYASSLSSASGMVGNNTSRRPPSYTDAAATEVEGPAMLDSVSSALQPSGYQPAWVGALGQVSMADIVKMGKPHSKASSTPSTSHNINHHHNKGPSFTAYQNLWFSENLASKVSEEHLEPGVSSAQHVSMDDEWPSIEQPAPTSVPSVSKPLVYPDLHPDSSNLPFDSIDRHSGADEVQSAEDGSIEDHDANHVGSGTVSSRKLQEDNSASASLFENDLYRNRGSYQPQNYTFDNQGVENVSISVSSVTANLQQLSIQKEDRAFTLERDGPSVVIPDHLQVQTADCSHLSFGSFGSGISSSFSGPLASMPVRINLEEAPTEAEGSSVGQLETRNSECYGDESLRNPSDGNLFHITGASTGSYNSSSASQSEPLKVENLEIEHRNQYAFPSSTPGYSFENPKQSNIGFSELTSSQMQNFSPFANVMPSYTNSLPNTLLAANAAPGRESDLPYPFPATQSMGTQYDNSVSSIGGPSISMAEALKTVGFSSTQPTPQSISGTSVATGPALPQQLAAHPYSQPTLPLGPYANMIGYPFLPPSYAYLPSAFQQAFASTSTYHQSVPAVLPQYKNSVSVSSLPQSAAVASGYGAFGSSTTLPGNFPMNLPAAPSGTNLGYDDVLSAQYKDSNHLISLHQSDSSGMWLHGPGSTTMSAVPASTYYSLPGQNQQPGGFRQGQQPSQNYGALGYPNFYHSQAGMSLDHQQQNPRDGSLSGSQGQPKQSQQIWQNGY